jgi:hypothetical protein
MKKKLLDTALLLFLIVIWLFPFRMQVRDWVSAAAVFLSFCLLRLIPQRTAAFAAAAALTAAVSLYDGEYLIGFAPGILACAALFTAACAGQLKRGKKDGVFFAAAGAAAACILYGAIRSAVRLAVSPIWKTAFERYDAYTVLAAAFTVYLLILTLKMSKKGSAAGRKEPDRVLTELAVAYALITASFCVSAICVFTQTGFSGAALLPVLVNTFAAATVRTPAADRLFRCAEAERR